MSKHFAAATILVMSLTGHTYAAQMRPEERGSAPSQIVFAETQFGDTITITERDGFLGLSAVHVGNEGGRLYGAATIAELRARMEREPVVTLTFEGERRETLKIIKQSDGDFLAALRGGIWLSYQE